MSDRKESLLESCSPRILAALVAAVILFGYAAPSLIYQRPFGTDVYTHMVFTKYLHEEGSLAGFYKKLQDDPGAGELGEGYPFGLWIFGATIAKATGIPPYTLAYVLPFILLLLLCILYYSYSNIFLRSKAQSLLSVGFLLSMPLISINLLRYRSSVFASILLVAIIMLNQKDNIRLRKNIPLTTILVFALCISHAGSYLFLLAFVIAYAFMKAALWGLFQRRMYTLLSVMIIVYVVTMNAFPNIHVQYETKSTFFLTISNTASKLLHTSIPTQVGEIFYNNIFVDYNIFLALIWSMVFYSLCRLIVQARIMTIRKIQILREDGFFITIPFIGKVQNISHSVIATPIWSGPAHMLFSILGYRRLNIKGQCMLLTSMIVTLIPAALHGGATGALREIYYLFLILPVASAAGFAYVLEKAGEKLNGKAKQVSEQLLLAGVFSIMVVTPILGNVYYLPSTSGAESDISALDWLKNAGSPDEKVVAYGYRHMVDVYANKSNPRVRYGTETILFLQNLLNTFFSEGTDKFADGLYYTFQGNYIVSSEKIIRNLRSVDSMVRKRKPLNYLEPEEIHIGENSNLDKIYSGQNNFSIYKYIPSPSKILFLEGEENGIHFKEEKPVIKDAGISFLIETEKYLLMLDKEKPQVTYIGRPGLDLLDEGYLADQAVISVYAGPLHGHSMTIPLSSLNYTEISVVGESIVYDTIIRAEDDNPLARMSVKYTFRQGAILKQVMFSNDYVQTNRDFTLNFKLYTTLYSPDMPDFEYRSPRGKRESKRIYPSDDLIRLRDENFQMLYTGNNDTGILFDFMPSNPYPDEIRYKGSTVSPYRLLSFGQSARVNPASRALFKTYISIGTLDVAVEDSELYKSVRQHPYPNSEIPFLVVASMPGSGVGKQQLKRAVEATQSSGWSIIHSASPQYYYENRDLLGDDNMLWEAGFSEKGSFKSYASQEYSIDELEFSGQQLNLDVDGVVAKDLIINLDSVRAMRNTSYGYVIAQAESTFWGPYYQGGLKHPRRARVIGGESDVWVIPATSPTGRRISPEKYGEFTETWKSIISASARHDDLSVLVMPSDILTGGYFSELVSLIEHAQQMGLSYQSPSEIIAYNTAIEDVETMVSMDGGEMTINVSNNGVSGINGLSYAVSFLSATGECNFDVEGAEIMREKSAYRECKIYISLDVGSGTSETVKIKGFPDYGVENKPKA